MPDFKTVSVDNSTQTKASILRDGENLVIRHEQDTTAIQEAAKQERNAYQAGKLIGDTQRHRQKVAEVPTSIYFQLIAKFGTPRQNPRDWQKWLSENPDFKTTNMSW
jgi:hypothetical protein